MRLAISTLVFVVATAPGLATTFDFNSNNGGFTAANAVGPAPLWTYITGASCLGGSGGCWSVDDPAVISDKLLFSPLFLATGVTPLSFTHNVNLQSTLDAGVVEISVNGGSFVNVTTLGAFAGFAYNGSISTCCGNPISAGGQLSGFTAGPTGFQMSSINLALNNLDTFQLRWRMGSDNSGAGGGWVLDNVVVGANLAPVAGAPEPAAIGLVLTGLAVITWRSRRRKNRSA